MNGLQAPGSEVGGRFGPYELRSLLGSGSMGEVYAAYDTVKERVVALKLLAGDLADDPEYQIRFRRESQTAARLAEPHIIPIHDWGVIDGRLFIDMRLVQGQDLRAVLRDSGPLHPERAVTVLEQIGAALDAAHTDGLVHRDVKPENILVTAADFAYLADFGIARHEGDTGTTRSGISIGSYTYMAPERFEQGRVTGRADIYSLACVLHECLTGSPPFPAGSVGMLIRSHLAGTPPRASIQRTGLPAGFDDVIACGMAKEPHERFTTAGELAVAARAALKSAARPPQASPGPPARPGEHTATPPDPADGAPPTGGIPSLVVRMPRRDDDGVPDPTTTLPTIIPGDPTSVRPTDTEYIPLSEDESPTKPPSTPPSGVRPFPDAHLFSDQQVHPDAAPETGGLPVADFYPPEQATRVYGGGPGAPPPRSDDTTWIPGPMSPAADFAGPSPADEVPHAGFDAEARSVTGDWWTAGVADRSDERGPAHPYGSAGYGSGLHGPEAYYAGAGDAEPYGAEAYSAGAYGAEAPGPESDRPSAYGPEAYSAGAYGPGAYGAGAYDPEAYSESPAPAQDPYQAAYEAGYRDSYAASANQPPAPGPGGGQRSRFVPILVGAGVFAVIVLLAVLGTALLGSDEQTPATAEASGTATTSAAPSSTAPTTETRSTTTTATTTTRAQVPAGAQPCTTAPDGSAYGSSAAGTEMTSCGFAEAVRQAYQDPGIVSAEGEPVPIEAASPVTGQVYTMTCTADEGLVTCEGGNNAVVYLY